MSDKRPFNWLLLIPPLAFLALAGGFYAAMQRENRDELPSALVGRSAPTLALEPLLEGADPVTTEALTAPGVKLVNFWASWCGPCRAEHPTLQALADDGMTIIGINYKDIDQNAQAFLTELGNPFAQVGVDDTGRTGIDWGLYGVPETFVLDSDGKIITRYPGPITSRVLEERILPAIEAAN